LNKFAPKLEFRDESSRAAAYVDAYASVGIEMKKPFKGVEKFGVETLTPQEFLEKISTISLRLPDSLHNKVKEIAKKEGISINQFIASAVSEKMSAFATEDYLERRAERANREKFEEALSQIPDVEPEEYDKL